MGRLIVFASLPLRLVPPKAGASIKELVFRTVPSVTKVEVKRYLEALYGLRVTKPSSCARLSRSGQSGAARTPLASASLSEDVPKAGRRGAQGTKKVGPAKEKGDAQGPKRDSSQAVSRRFSRNPKPASVNDSLSELVDEADIMQVAESLPDPPKLPEYYADDAVGFGAARAMIDDRISDYEEFPWRPGAPRLVLMEEAHKRKAEMLESLSQSTAE